MIYGNMPMMIFVLAAGYLFTVYLLLALAKRTGQKPVPKSVTSASSGKHKREISLTPNVTKVVNSQ
ncbi:hypothetical protein PI95_023260 [Hassallia byssoidea VB512170]|jgi:hypothetical protein|uniref:Uncharacterized protein n=1 Tax=Hassallia byssoidea VB512170 TaxID=1304833 RepID=A0A846HFI5_9CYAN|nr:hypothetical protein [Hassalia byssoidea]MBW4567981.1 hypothetical protein [Tolypothrix carrinoi HA7290-LM1]NEU75394.1 hypothetical protein [Hassalia byssoidea VB512170]